MFTQHGKPTRVQVVRYDPIDRVHVVSQNGVESRLNLHALGERVRAVRTESKRERAASVFLYMCEIGPNGLFKVGATSAPEQRRKQIRTYTSHARMRAVVRVRSPGAWSARERSVLKRFAHYRPRDGGREVLRLTSTEAAECAEYMRAVCAQ